MPIINVLVDESQLRRSLAELKRALKSLSDQARVYRWQLIAINNHLEGIVRKKRKYTRKPKAEHTNIPQSVKSEVCPLCNGNGSIALDKIGLVSKFCTCEAGKALKEKVIAGTR